MTVRLKSKVLELLLRRDSERIDVVVPVVPEDRRQTASDSNSAIEHLRELSDRLAEADRRTREALARRS